MSNDIQPLLFESDVKGSVQRLVTRIEDQWFDRKSIRTKPDDLAEILIAFANADGGSVCVGISNGKIEGIDREVNRLNALLQASLDHTEPTVRQTHSFYPCTNEAGDDDRILVLEIDPSERVHRKKNGRCFLRVGDETRRLGPEEERELSYDKGESQFDRTLVPETTLEDLDPDAVAAYVARVSATDAVKLLVARHLYVPTGRRTGLTLAGLLLLGTNPPVNSYLRYIRHIGTTVETGIRSNVAEDIRLEGTIPDLISRARDLLGAKIGTVERLGPDGRFRAIPLLPEFAWLEAIVNALTHRSYSIQGDGIRVRDFEDRLVVESPGRLPGLVRIENIQNHRYSRNPHIARALGEMTGYVRELNEGVRRMFEEMSAYGLRPPRFEDDGGQVRVTLYKQPGETESLEDRSFESALAVLSAKLGEDKVRRLLSSLREGHQLRTSDLESLLGVSAPTARTYMRSLESRGLVRQILQSSTDPTRYWILTDHPFWTRRL